MLQSALNSGGTATARLSALLAITMIVASPAVAHESQDAFEMTVIRDAAYGGHVASGNYDIAISKITSAKIRPSAQFFASNNLCVAYAKSHDIDAAKKACDDALTLISVESQKRSGHIAQIQRRYKAMALSNRGVLRAVSGDDENARKDFQEAVDLEAGLSAPARNLANLESRAQLLTSLQTDR